MITQHRHRFRRVLLRLQCVAFSLLVFLSLALVRVCTLHVTLHVTLTEGFIIPVVPRKSNPSAGAAVGAGGGVTFLSGKTIISMKPPSNHNMKDTSTDDINNINNINNKKHTKELFSVAPMMAHTNRHYRFFWRLFSSHAFLYTEMIPAGQIVNAYERERERLRIMMMGKKDDTQKNNSSSEQFVVNTDEILDVVSRIIRNDEEGHLGGKNVNVNSRGNIESLNEMLRFAKYTTTTNSGICYAGTNIGQTTLQIGGSDPYLLAKASAIGSAFGYTCINLNCGCPSSAVSGRSGGASLMKEPMHVAKCVESMNVALTDLYHSSTASSSTSSSSSSTTSSMATPTPISVKHRLGVRDASTYDAEKDRLKDDEEEAFPNCCDFVNAITFSGNVRTLQVHTRLGLLGDFDANPTDDPSSSSSSSPSSSSPTLWVPGGENTQSKTNENHEDKSIDHKRAQYQAKKRARKATIQNRSIPPLRPNIVNLLADEFPQLDFVANGGIHSMEDVQDRIETGPNSVIGAMVGRAAINHPCSFALADSLWCDDENDNDDDNDDENDSVSTNTNTLPSRGDVLLEYIEYCEQEEERVKAMGVNMASLAALRRRLVAVPFHLFVGEECNDIYQRRIRKLVSRAERHTAKSTLMAALMELPPESIQKNVGEFIPIEELKVYNYVERSGPLQKNIY